MQRKKTRQTKVLDPVRACPLDDTDLLLFVELYAKWKICYLEMYCTEACWHLGQQLIITGLVMFHT